MLRSWSFTDLEMLVLWEELGEEHLPEPLFFASRAPLWSAFQDSKFRARDGLRDRDPDIDEVLRVLHTPEVRVEVRGWDGIDRANPEGSIRAIGARSGEAAYLLVQQPGETIRHAAGFTITELWANQLAEQIVGLLPDAPAGHGSEIVLAEAEDVADTEYEFGLSPAHETLEGGIVDRAAEFLAAPASTMGTIDVVQGRSRFGPRGITRHRLRWRDLAEDGRYLITADHPPIALPADRRRVVAEVELRIAEVVLVLTDEWEMNQ
ncbi:ESX secretion-associated protein EspG [Nocardia concava]|uniref:ESX secretion-associated protein EspG n=1 Tax=Nocardia concava TaxID=257281 RepID=UPI0002F41375|nr:ESX secretion-associated protein EspG [Nocardia concava]